MTGDLVPLTPSWVELVGPAAQLAGQIARTEFVPRDLRGKPEAVLAAVLFGHEVGVGPMTALSKVHVVEGRPTMAADLMRALGLAQGHDMWVEEAGGTRVTACGRRKGSEHVTKVTWTMDDAKRAGLAGKQNWARYPRQMLLARATAELARLVWPDALGGVSYATEELQDEPAAGLPVADMAEPAQPQRRTRQRATVTPVQAAVGSVPDDPPALPAARPEPALPGEDEPGTVTVTQPQLRKIMALYRDLEVTDPDDQKHLVASVLGVEIESHKHLRIGEASTLIEALEAAHRGDRTILWTDAGPLVGTELALGEVS